MKNENKRELDWSSLLLGILFILASIILFLFPTESMVVIVFTFAILAIIKGIFELFLRDKTKELTGYKMYTPIIMGIVDLLLGIYLLFNLDIGLVALPFAFAIWFLLDSIFNLLMLDFEKNKDTFYFWFILIVNVLGIGLGVFLLFNPFSSIIALNIFIGVYFMIFGITKIIYAFK
ncbi:HdeD family acid-resistance protein [Enterococcus faecalis]|uniref:HdeD family acid-resistance protein n=1 Tax=Enterococcus faecalis TaxID=1351 RepID=UPI002DB5F039|nr:DUF308 domain-containing protein [Enterococcus faecalis]MEB7792121.1 DUF308 domain-containing protein [Enterococcus faecalis]MEB7810092.1 DUF308 domain-containing protein [Enterococcus faecalis]